MGGRWWKGQLAQLAAKREVKAESESSYRWKVDVKAGEVGVNASRREDRRVDVVQSVSVYLPGHLIICGDTPGKASRGSTGE